MPNQQKNEDKRAFSTYADRLNHLMKVRKISMNKLSKITELPYGTVYNHTRGKKASMDDVVKIATTLNANLLWLATGDGEMEQPSAAGQGEITAERFRHISIDVETAGNLLTMILERFFKKEDDYAILHIRHYFTLLCLAASGGKDAVNEKIIHDVLSVLEKQ